METLHLILDYTIIPIVLWNIWLTLRTMAQNEKISLLAQEGKHAAENRKNLWQEIRSVETEIKAELKDIKEKIEKMPELIAKLIGK